MLHIGRKAKAETEVEADVESEAETAPVTLSLQEAVVEGFREAAQDITVLQDLSDPLFKALQELDAAGTLPVSLNPVRQFYNDAVDINMRNVQSNIRLCKSGSVIVNCRGLVGIHSQEKEAVVPEIIKAFIKSASIEVKVRQMDLKAAPAAPAF